MDDGPASDSLDVPAPAGGNFGADTDNGSTLSIMPGPAAAAAAYGQAGACRLFEGAFEKLRQMASALFVRTPKKPGSLALAYSPASRLAHPGGADARVWPGWVNPRAS